VPADLHSVPFDPVEPKAALAQLPQSAAVFALYGADAHAEPYIGRTPNLRGRLERLLQPSPRHPRRLQLAGRVRRIAYRHSGSDFESLLAQFALLEQVYGAKALDRMHLRAPAFIRFLGSNPYPRITVTHRPSLREADWAYGPFASRAAAERFADEALKLFLLRRCTDELHPHPAHPGCVYSEMKMCLAPCYQGCTEARYGEESTAVEQFLSTRGESRLVTLRTQRDQASTDLEFESAAQLHAQVQRVEAVRALAPELVRPLSQLRAVLLQASSAPDQVAVFLFDGGRIHGPAAFSTVGMRIQNEQSGSSSLFAQPMALEPVPEEPVPGETLPGDPLSGDPLSGDPLPEIPVSESQPSSAPLLEARDWKGLRLSPGEDAPEPPEASAPVGTSPAVSLETIPQPARLSRNLLESRLDAALSSLTNSTSPATRTEHQGHLALLKRWYYRPEIRRSGEIFFPDPEGQWPVRQILRGIGRVAAKMLPPAHRA
jgi:excinuclease ABC subunit C